MSHGQPTVGAIGYEIFIATGLDLDPASGITINWRAPDATTGSWTATAHTKPSAKGNTSYGAHYITVADTDLSQAGTWDMQVAVVMPGFTGAGQIAKLTVIEAIDPEL